MSLFWIVGFPESDPPSLKAMSIYELQAKAFLVASEDVDIDQEIIQDILEGLNRDNEAITAEEVAEGDEDGSSLTGDEFEGELDISALYSNAFDGEIVLVMSIHCTIYSLHRVFNSIADKPPRWSKQEVRYMLIHLKERGKLAVVLCARIRCDTGLRDGVVDSGICCEATDKYP
jgi:hypothetical protein